MRNVLIHINESIEESGRFRLEESLRDVADVIAPRFGQDRDHLMFVVYDPKSTTAAAILGQIRDQLMAPRSWRCKP